MRQPLALVVGVLAALAAAAALASLLTGPAHVSLADLFAAADSVAVIDPRLVVWELRMPRTVLTFVVGAVLAVSGAVMQGLFRNPLADPSIIGVTSGASLGASVAIVFGASIGGYAQWAGLSVVALGAFAGGLAASALVTRWPPAPAALRS